MSRVRHTIILTAAMLLASCGGEIAGLGPIPEGLDATLPPPGETTAGEGAQLADATLRITIPSLPCDSGDVFISILNPTDMSVAGGGPAKIIDGTVFWEGEIAPGSYSIIAFQDCDGTGGEKPTERDFFGVYGTDSVYDFWPNAAPSTIQLNPGTLTEIYLRLNHPYAMLTHELPALIGPGHAKVWGRIANTESLPYDAFLFAGIWGTDDCPPSGQDPVAFNSTILRAGAPLNSWQPELYGVPEGEFCMGVGFIRLDDYGNIPPPGTPPEWWGMADDLIIITLDIPEYVIDSPITLDEVEPHPGADLIRDYGECFVHSVATDAFAGGLVANMEFDHGWQEYDPGPAPYSPTRRNAPNNRVTNLTPWLETFTVDRDVSYTRTVEEGRTETYPSGTLHIPIDGTFETSAISCGVEGGSEPLGCGAGFPDSYSHTGDYNLCIDLLCTELSQEIGGCATLSHITLQGPTERKAGWTFTLIDPPRIGSMALYMRYAYSVSYRGDFTPSTSTANFRATVRAGRSSSVIKTNCPRIEQDDFFYYHECPYQRYNVSLEDVTGRGQDVAITFELEWVDDAFKGMGVVNIDDIEFFDVNGRSLGHGPGDVQVGSSEEIIAPVVETVEENIDGEGSYWLNEFWNNRKIEPIIGYSDAVYDEGGNLVPIIPLSPDNNEFMFRSYVMTYSLDVYRYYDPYCNAGNGFAVRDRSVYEDHYNPPFRIDCYVETGGANLGSVSFGMDSTELSSIRTTSKKVLVDREEPSISNIRIYPDIVSNSQRFVKAEEGARICFDAHDDALIDRFFISRQPDVQDQQPPWIPIYESSPAPRVMATQEMVGNTWHICALTGPLEHNTVGLKVGVKDFSESDVFDSYQYREGKAERTHSVSVVGEGLFAGQDIYCDKYSVRAGEAVECHAARVDGFRNILQIYNEEGTRVSVRQDATDIQFTPQKSGKYYFESLYAVTGSDIIFGRTGEMAEIVVREERPSKPIAIGAHDRVIVLPTHRCSGANDTNGYWIYKGTCSLIDGREYCAEPSIKIAEIDTESFNHEGFVDTDVEDGRSYTYAVKSINEFGSESAMSDSDGAHVREYFVNFSYSGLPRPDRPTGFKVWLTDSRGLISIEYTDTTLPGRSVIAPFGDIAVSLLAPNDNLIPSDILFMQPGGSQLRPSFDGRTDDRGEVTGELIALDSAYLGERMRDVGIVTGDLAEKRTRLEQGQLAVVLSKLSVPGQCFHPPAAAFIFMGDGISYSSLRCSPTVVFEAELPIVEKGLAELLKELFLNPNIAGRGLFNSAGYRRWLDTNIGMYFADADLTSDFVFLDPASIEAQSYARGFAASVGLNLVLFDALPENNLFEVGSTLIGDWLPAMESFVGGVFIRPYAAMRDDLDRLWLATEYGILLDGIERLYFERNPYDHNVSFNWDEAILHIFEEQVRNATFIRQELEEDICPFPSYTEEPWPFESGLGSIDCGIGTNAFPDAQHIIANAPKIRCYLSQLVENIAQFEFAWGDDDPFVQMLHRVFANLIETFESPTVPGTAYIDLFNSMPGGPIEIPFPNGIIFRNYGFGASDSAGNIFGAQIISPPDALPYDLIMVNAYFCAMYGDAVPTMLLHEGVHSTVRYDHEVFNPLLDSLFYPDASVPGDSVRTRVNRGKYHAFTELRAHVVERRFERRDCIGQDEYERELNTFFYDILAPGTYSIDFTRLGMCRDANMRAVSLAEAIRKDPASDGVIFRNYCLENGLFDEVGNRWTPAGKNSPWE